MLNAGPSGPPFAPYEHQKASKLGRSRIEGFLSSSTDMVGSRAVFNARRRNPRTMAHNSTTARPRDRPLSVIGKAVRPAKN